MEHHIGLEPITTGWKPVTLPNYANDAWGDRWVLNPIVRGHNSEALPKGDHHNKKYGSGSRTRTYSVQVNSLIPIPVWTYQNIKLVQRVGIEPTQHWSSTNRSTY